MQTINLKTNKGNSINEVILIKPDIFSDKRGFFYESWNLNSFKKIIGKTNFCQDNHSNSIKGVLRGIHYQLNPTAQGKLVRCTKGEIYDVAVDLRKRSNTYKEWIGVKLNELNKDLFWIPEGFGHGFLTLSDIAEVQYKVTKPWNKLSEKSLLWNDSDLKIDWPLNKISPIISQKDSLGITIKEAENMDFVFQ